MPRLIWSPSALRDTQRLYRFSADKNINAAKRAIRAIREGVRILELQPEVGKPAEDLEPAYREWFIEVGDSGYLVLYRFYGQSVIIVAVRHQKEVGFF